MSKGEFISAVLELLLMVAFLPVVFVGLLVHIASRTSVWWDLGTLLFMGGYVFYKVRSLVNFLWPKNLES